MTEPAARELLESRKAFWIVSSLTIALLAVANLPWQLDDYDQAKQAFTSWQMVKSARICYQETPFGKIATKPPLAGWLSAVIYECTRSWDLAWRLPSFAAALAIAVILWRRATLLYGALAGIVAGAAFGLNLLTPRLATLVRTDMPLALVTFLIALLFFEQIRCRRRWSGRERSALFALLTASMLIKGPIVYAFVLPALVLFAWRRRNDGAFIRTGCWPWLASLAVFIVWVIGGIKTVPGFYDEVVVREFLGRFGETIHKPQPIYFYGPHLLHKWAPWSLLLIALVVVNARAAHRHSQRWLAEWTPEMFWLLAWSVGGFIVMSCIPSKRVDRIFPVIAPMCLLLAGLVTRDSRHSLARWCAASLAAAVVFTGSYSAFKVVSGIRKRRDGLLQCGREFRSRAAQHHWQFAVLPDRDEALAIYFNQPDFTDKRTAIDLWNTGKLNCLVLSERVESEIFSRLRRVDAATSIELCPTGDKESRYVALVR